jgi:GR25 family glycosyltransferase involved in LPS biosynthesis
MLPDSFEEILQGPCYVLNLDRCVKRWEVTSKRLKAAGFTPERRSSVDGMKLTNRVQKWLDFGVHTDFKYAFDSDGQCCSGLTHTSAWEHIVQNNIPFACIFEDDIFFHKDWHSLAPKFYEQTDKNIDVVFFGSQGAGPRDKPMITSYPVFCIHAYMVTLEGAKKLLHAIRTAPKLYVMDCFTIDLMNKGPACPFTWQCWNATMYEDPARHNSLEVRNDGLVFQDEDFPSDIHAQSGM